MVDCPKNLELIRLSSELPQLSSLLIDIPKMGPGHFYRRARSDIEYPRYRLGASRRRLDTRFGTVRCGTGRMGIFGQCLDRASVILGKSLAGVEFGSRCMRWLCRRTPYRPLFASLTDLQTDGFTADLSV